MSKKLSESFWIGSLLSISGGIMDGYSYLHRGQVFANAQTGNLLLFGVSLSKGEWGQVLHYFIPILSFVIGILLSCFCRSFFPKQKKVRWQHLALLFEIILLFSVAFIPENLVANALISLSCGIQVESFRNIEGNPAATTMCIGNLRAGTHHLWHSIKEKDRSSFHASLLYYGLILAFILGAVGGNFLIELFQDYAIWASVLFLFFVFLALFFEKEPDKLDC